MPLDSTAIAYLLTIDIQRKHAFRLLCTNQFVFMCDDVCSDITDISQEFLSLNGSTSFLYIQGRGITNQRAYVNMMRY